MAGAAGNTPKTCPSSIKRNKEIDRKINFQRDNASDTRTALGKPGGYLGSCLPGEEVVSASLLSEVRLLSSGLGELETEQKMLLLLGQPQAGSLQRCALPHLGGPQHRAAHWQ